MTPAALLDRALRRDPAHPLLTWYDDATGDRVELSVATCGNWAAKIAGSLVDDYDVEPGRTVSVHMPLHWQTAVVLLGVWLTGATLSVDGAADVLFHAGELSAVDGSATVELSLHPLGADLSRLVGAQPDTFAPITPVDPDLPALRIGAREWTHERLGDLAVAAARHHGLGATSRVLSTLGYDSVDGLDAGLLVPLAAGGSVVLVSHAEGHLLAAKCDTERVTHTAGVGVRGLPRLS